MIIPIMARLVPKSFSVTSREHDDSFVSFVNSHNTVISEIARHYRTLWYSLSSKFICNTGGKAAKVMSIAQSFFKNASSVKLCSLGEELMDDDMDEPEEANTDFIQFISRMLSDAVIVLWPENSTMVFPRFLADNKYYETLREYCKRSEPYSPHLAAAFVFFKGIALVGMGMAENAALTFEEASHGIVAEDAVLNNVLRVRSKVPLPRLHTLADFYSIVMNIFRDHNFPQFVIQSGIFALKFAAATDPLLPSIYSLLFTQYSITGQYSDALRVLHLNPSKSSQLSCLRNLIGVLLDNRNSQTLVSLHYRELTDQAADLLETRCRSVSPLTDNGLYEITYAFYLQRYMYAEAARLMHQLSWRLRFEPQSREVLNKRLHVLACVSQTVEMIEDGQNVHFDADVTNLVEFAMASEENSSADLNIAKTITKQDIYDEFLILQARVALIDIADFANGPPNETSEIYDECIKRKLYDLSFTLHRHFDLEIGKFFSALAQDCFDIGVNESNEMPNWVLSNRRFVDSVSDANDGMGPHWKLLVTFIDLTLKNNNGDVRALRIVLNAFLERNVDLPSWLESRFMTVNSREFLVELIEFDEIHYALNVLSKHIDRLSVSRLRPREIPILPLSQISAVIELANGGSQENEKVLNGKRKERTIQDEFFGVYCLISRSENPSYKNRCYIGYTVDPNRRVRQHNAGKEHGGAGKTNNRGPWDMVCVVHGFPNSIIALRFEWAWQNPQQSKRIRDFFLRKGGPKESHFAFKLRIVCHMLNVEPWKNLALTFRWLLPECEIPFPIALPAHINVEKGLVHKTMSVIPLEFRDYKPIENCIICGEKICRVDELLECLLEECKGHFHVQCLAEYSLDTQKLTEFTLFPQRIECPRCESAQLWGNLVRHQRCLNSIEESKPLFDGVPLAVGMIPKKVSKQ